MSSLLLKLIVVYIYTDLYISDHKRVVLNLFCLPVSVAWSESLIKKKDLRSISTE